MQAEYLSTSHIRAKGSVSLMMWSPLKRGGTYQQLPGFELSMNSGLQGNLVDVKKFNMNGVYSFTV